MAGKLLKKGNLERLIGSVTEAGGRFVAPSLEARQVVFKEVRGGAEVTLDYILPRNSYKEVLFPQTEVVANFRMTKEGLNLENAAIDPVETVVFGARPCEAASISSLRSVFTWDFRDEFYTKREERLIVASIACTKGDSACFCTTVGLSPESREGSDIYLRETEEGDFLVEAATEKGSSFLERNGAVFEDAESQKPKKLFIPEKIEGIDLGKISSFLKDRGHYESPLWAELTRKCIGCGACTYACPTCHCFDIIDEGTAFEGERRKNWDSCQFDSFTLHASGHNPRDAQYKRWRNRLMCKFNFYPEKFSSKGCVGCGRCIRVCPVRLDITEVMEEISRS